MFRLPLRFALHVRARALLGPLCGLCLCLAGCTRFPELDAESRERIRGDRPAPVIAPIDAIRAEADAIAITDADTATLQARGAALQARGAALQGPVGDPATVARLTDRAFCRQAGAGAGASAGPGSACVASPDATR